jgi:hypothetical protein
MTIAYLIATHDSPNQTRRLIKALSSPSARFYVHVDAKADQRAFNAIAGGAVKFIEKRVRVYWGEFSQVQASLNLIEAALADPRRCERLVLLSGTDFPLRSSRYIEQFFAAAVDTEFINSVALPSAAAKKPLARIAEYRIRRSSPAPWRLVQRILLEWGVLPRMRDHRASFGDLAPFGGSSWWALSRAACERIMAFVERNPAFVRFFHNTFCPDESFFQTILNNSPGIQTKIARSVTFADWSAGGANPAFMSEKHLELFGTGPFIISDAVYGSGEMLFARKFRDGDAQLVEKLERQRHGSD